MRQRVELAVGTVLVMLLAVGAGLLGLRRARVTDADFRRSTYLSGPSGSRGFAEALERLGVRVERLSRPTVEADSFARAGTVVAVLGPTQPLDAREGVALGAARADLLLAGVRAAAAVRCFGYDVLPGGRDSLRVVPAPGGEPFPRVAAVLHARSSPVAVDSTGAEDDTPVTCTAPVTLEVDTLLRTARGRPVALRLLLQGGRQVTLVADDRLFSNRALRTTGAGPFALGLVVGRYDHLVADEYHHGFDASTTLTGATRDWLLRSPWGWALLQLAAVGTVALLAAGVRFGPSRPAIERRRRSPLEHVRALATALAAARGHDVAVGLLVQGLRRRLSGAGRPARGEAAAWLEGLAPAVRTPRGAAALATLAEITGGGASAEDVRRAAHAVETLWEELTPT